MSPDERDQPIKAAQSESTVLERSIEIGETEKHIVEVKFQTNPLGREIIVIDGREVVNQGHCHSKIACEVGDQEKHRIEFRERWFPRPRLELWVDGNLRDPCFLEFSSWTKSLLSRPPTRAGAWVYLGLGAGLLTWAILASQGHDGFYPLPGRTWGLPSMAPLGGLFILGGVTILIERSTHHRGLMQLIRTILHALIIWILATAILGTSSG